MGCQEREQTGSLRRSMAAQVLLHLLYRLIDAEEPFTRRRGGYSLNVATN